MSSQPDVLTSNDTFLFTSESVGEGHPGETIHSDVARGHCSWLVIVMRFSALQTNCAIRSLTPYWMSVYDKIRSPKLPAVRT